MLDGCLTCLSKSKETVHQCQVCQFAFGNPAQISVSSFFHKMCKVITEFISYWIRLSLQEEPQKWRLIHTTHCGWVPFMNPLSARFPTVARMEHLTMNGRVFFTASIGSSTSSVVMIVVVITMSWIHSTSGQTHRSNRIGLKWNWHPGIQWSHRTAPRHFFTRIGQV